MNLLTVICHDLGRRLGCYGVPGLRTPAIDAFAASGTRFDNAFCAAPQCSPARAALWTGRYPHANGVIGLAHSDFRNDLHPSERHLAQILAEKGYRTDLVGIQHVSPSAGRCGFQHVHLRGPCGPVAEETARVLKAMGKDQPFFIQVGFSEPHRPFRHDGQEPPDPATVHVPPFLPDIPIVREDLALMDASIAAADCAFGKILNALTHAGLADDTLVLFVADHGIPFPRAKMSLYDPGLEIALLMRIPGHPGSQEIADPIAGVDVLPTLLDLLGCEIPGNLHGRSFKAQLFGETCTPRDAVFAEKTYHTYYDPMRAVRTDRWKLIANFEFAPHQETSPDYDNNAHGYPEVSLSDPPAARYHPPFELYDLQADPWERMNLADDPSCTEVRIALARRLRDWMQTTGDPLLNGPIPQATYTHRMAEFLAL